MAALDTNVVLRLMLGDDAAQARAADAMVLSEPCTVAASVLMECEWVLRGGYRLEPAEISRLLSGLLELQNIDAQEPALAEATLKAYAAGLDFADALHALQAGDQGFATFDKTLVRRAAKIGLRGVGLVPRA
jgi:predicted nucleic-acid-binding protein